MARSHSTPSPGEVIHAQAQLAVAVEFAAQSARKLRGRRRLTQAAAIALGLLCRQVAQARAALAVIDAAREVGK